jgi:hypothetical protein
MEPPKLVTQLQPLGWFSSNRSIDGDDAAVDFSLPAGTAKEGKFFC